LSSFSEQPLLPSLLASLAEQKLTQPTEIQERTLPSLLDGRSLIGVSETGSGKTLAYVLPMLHQIKSLELDGSAVSTPGCPRGLVLVPNRELGEQVSKVFKSLTHGTRVRVRTVLGGSAKKMARRNVSGNFEILVATPGRLLQLLDSREVQLSDVRTLVFDEADQMIDPGFLPVANRVIGDCPKGIQLVMFSATLPDSVKVVMDKLFTRVPIQVQTAGSHHVVPTLTIDNRAVINGRRFELLRLVLAEDPKIGTLLFANTREQCDKIADWLDGEGIAYVNYRGQMDRIERRANLARFRKGEVSLLVATDLGGRGLDIWRAQRVINVHLPREIDNYLHRVGRTARAGRAGLVVNLVTERDQPLLDKLAAREALRG